MNAKHDKTFFFDRTIGLTVGVVIATAFGTASAAGCRVDPGDTDYGSQQLSDFVPDEPDSGADEFLVGPDPYTEGVPRLTFGPFYEGAQSDEIPIDDMTNFFFVFDADGRSSLEIVPSDDRIEGFSSDAFIHQGTSFWGMSLAWFDGNPDEGASPRPEDLTRWTTMHISLKSSDPAFGDVTLGIVSTAGEGNVSAASYGYANDGAWHTLDIPLEDFGVDLSAITTPLVMTGMLGTAGDTLLVDNFYYSADPE